MNTEYGKMSIIRPMLKKKLMMSNSLIRDVTIINDNTSTNHLYAMMKKKNDFFLVKPESHFGNSVSLLKSIRGKLSEDYFGTEKKPENPFRNCKTPNEIFNLSRNIKFQLKMSLSRMGYILLRNGELSVMHKEGSVLQNNASIQAIMMDFIKKHETSLCESNENKFTRYDYFVSAEMVEGIISANNYIQKGITVGVLGEKKVYTNYGVFNPTRQDYLNLFDSFLKENVRDLKMNVKNVADLGCGTGILSLIMSHYGLPKIFAFDINDNAILSTKSNAQAFGYFDNIKTVKLDLVENYHKEGTKIKITNENPESEQSEEININSKSQKKKERQETSLSNTKETMLIEKGCDPNYDLIVSNPPWMNASYVFTQTDLENAVYDPEHKFLKSAFNFAKIHLSRTNREARFIIIFSDLGSILNINDSDIIEKLALENKLKISSVKSKGSELKTSDKSDPLKNFKKEAKVFLYELKRI